MGLLGSAPNQVSTNADLGTMAFQDANAIGVGQIQFNTSNPLPSYPPGTLAWDPVAQTLELGMPYSITQQIGMEYYAPVYNSTGSTITNGTVVGFYGTGVGDTLGCSPFIANGTLPTIYVLGVMTHDLTNLSSGYCTVFGFVHSLNTTGSSVGETWLIGDMLYASPTTAGKLTKVKPTAPNNVVPVAAVTTVDATNGAIFVRPTLQMQSYYGVFSDSTTKTATAIYTPQAITMNTTNSASGVALGTPTSRVVINNAGLYNFQFSLQLASSTGTVKNIWIWPRINGVDVTNSNTQLSISGSGTTMAPAWNFVLSMTAGQYFELMFAVDDVTFTIPASAAQVGANGIATFARPAMPSIILTVTQVQQ